ATADSDDAPFTKQYLYEQLRILGEHDFAREYLGVPSGGPPRPFPLGLFERADYLSIPPLPPGAAVAHVPADPSLWPINHLLIAHDVGRTNDRSTAVVGGYSPLRPDELIIKEINELPQGYFGHKLASEVSVVDARHQRNAVILPDLSNDASYAEV